MWRFLADGDRALGSVRGKLLVRGCSWQCCVSREEVEVESYHGQYLNSVHCRVSGSGGAIHLLHTCLLCEIKMFAWSLSCLFNQGILTYLRKGR